MEFSLLQNIHSTTVPTQATTELVSRYSFSTGRATQFVKLTTHLDLVLRLRNSGAVPLLPIQTSTVCQGQVYLYYAVSSCDRTFTFISQNFPLYEGLDNENIQLDCSNNLSYQQLHKDCSQNIHIQCHFLLIYNSLCTKTP